LRSGGYAKSSAMLAELQMEDIEDDPDRPVCRTCELPMWLVTYTPKMAGVVEKEERTYQCEVCGCKAKVLV
jgi:Zn finger protein HypA/HybF involved in hydrogenase expression